MQNGQIKTITTYPAVVGSVLAQMRTEQGLHQGEVANAVGVTQATWSRIENGQSNVTVEHLRMAADKLGIQPSQILLNADRHAANIQMGGIDVVPTRHDAEIHPAVVLLVGTALGALMTYAIVNSKG
jgi:transcriptional regulator with XRE-family HTH domain